MNPRVDSKPSVVVVSRSPFLLSSLSRFFALVSKGQGRKPREKWTTGRRLQGWTSLRLSAHGIPFREFELERSDSCFTPSQGRWLPEFIFGREAAKPEPVKNQETKRLSLLRA